MGSAKPKLPSHAGQRALLNVAAGRSSAYGLSGRSAMGGHRRTMLALRNAGLIEAYPNENLTEAGRKVVALLAGPEGR